MQKTKYSLAFLCILFTGRILSQQQPMIVDKKTDSVISAQIKPDDPGCAVLVSKNGRILYQKAFGMASLELNVPLRTEHVFRIASMTKQFIAVAILQLEEKRLLDRRDDIRKYIPDFPTGNYIITIENLLTHTSGIKNLTSINGYDEFIYKKVTKIDLINYFKNWPIEFEPGTKISYDNSAYILLEYIIEAVSGKKLGQYLSDNIFVPLDMKSASLDEDGKIFKNKLPGYLNKNTAADWMSMTQVACLQMTVLDMAKWHNGLQEGKLISKENLKKAQQSYILKDGTETDYGYGWEIKDLNNRRLIQHGGGINGFGGYEVYDPEDSLFVVLLANSQSVSEEYIVDKIISIWAPNSGLLKEISIDQKMQKNFKGIYLFDNGNTRVKILTEGGRLYFTNRYPNSKWLMHFVAGNQIYVEEQYPFQYTFNADKQGNILGITIKGRGEYFENGIKAEKP